MKTVAEDQFEEMASARDACSENVAGARLLEVLGRQHSIGYWKFDRLAGTVELSDVARSFFPTEKPAEHASLSEVLAQIDPRDHARMHKRLRAALLHGADFTMMVRLKVDEGAALADKIVPTIKLSANCDFQDGRLLSVWGFVEDVSRHSHSRRELARAERSEARLMEAIRHMPEAFALYDEKDRLVFFNDAYKEFYRETSPVIEPGLTFEEIIRYGLATGQYLDAIGHEEEWLAERMERHNRADERPSLQRLPNGRWLQVREARLPDGGLAGFRVDITERKDLENRLKAALFEARAAGQLQNSMLPNLAHELRTPLNAIIGFGQMIDMALEQSEQTAKPKEHARDIVNAGGHLVAMIDNMFEVVSFDLTSAHDDILAVEDMRPVFLRKVIDKACRLVNYAVRQNNKHIIMIGDCTSSVIGDETRLVQVLLNLLSNAIKYSGSGQRIWINVEQGVKGYIRLSVIDEGEGVEPYQRAHLFERYARIEGTGKRGSGLGLAIVKELAESMNGSAGVGQAAQGGAEFWVDLPAANIRPAAPPVRTAPRLAG